MYHQLCRVEGEVIAHGVGEEEAPGGETELQSAISQENFNIHTEISRTLKRLCFYHT